MLRLRGPLLPSTFQRLNPVHTGSGFAEEDAEIQEGKEPGRATQLVSDRARNCTQAPSAPTARNQNSRYRKWQVPPL